MCAREKQKKNKKCASREDGWFVGYILWHINPYSLINTKAYFYIYISNIYDFQTNNLLEAMF